MNPVVIAFLLTLFAGLSTGIGSLIAFFAKRTNTSFLSASLGLSAGVMIYVSFVELLPGAVQLISRQSENGKIWGVVSFFAGIALIAIIDKLVPSVENPHEPKLVEDMHHEPQKNARLLRMSFMTALVIAIHNFPEGIVTFITTINEFSLGVPIAIAIAIHNIPEGIAVSVPIFYATGSRKKAFWYSFASGLAEPVGAFFAWLALLPFIKNNPELIGYVSAAVGGIMVYISLDELLPAAEEYGEHHLAIYGVIAGMAIMAITLLMF
jgi:ZIP family zinc transporter